MSLLQVTGFAAATLVWLAMVRGQDAALTPSAGEKPAQAVAMTPLARMLGQMRESLKVIQDEVRDYTAKIAQRERQKNRLAEQEILLAKIRSRRSDDQGKLKTPFSVYVKHLEPKSVAGREAIYVENRDGGKLIAHETGFTNLVRFKLDPNGSIAMQGRRHPITEIGIENLLVELSKKLALEGKQRKFEIVFKTGEQVDGRPCTLMEWTNLEQLSPDDVRLVRLYIEEERKVPLKFATYLWPEKAAGEARLDAEFTYRELKLNVGLTDADFDPDNPRYDFP